MQVTFSEAGTEHPLGKDMPRNSFGVATNDHSGYPQGALCYRAEDRLVNLVTGCSWKAEQINLSRFRPMHKGEQVTLTF